MLARDKDGSFLIDFDPGLFMPLLEMLRVSCIEGSGKAEPTPIYRALQQVLARVQLRKEEFKVMLNCYGLEDLQEQYMGEHCLCCSGGFEGVEIRRLLDIRKVFGRDGGIVLDTCILSCRWIHFNDEPPYDDEQPKITTSACQGHRSRGREYREGLCHDPSRCMGEGPELLLGGSIFQ